MAKTHLQRMADSAELDRDLRCMRGLAEKADRKAVELKNTSVGTMAALKADLLHRKISELEQAR